MNTATRHRDRFPDLRRQRRKEIEMTKTESIRIARKAVSSPIGSGTSWTLYGPYYADKPNGPSSENHADSYWSARAKRTEWVAYIALVLMGYDRADADCEVMSAIEKYCTDVNSIVNRCIEKLGKLN